MIRAGLLAAALALAGPALADLAALERAAEAGSAPAQRALAERLIEGDGVLPSYARAAALLRRAAEAGDRAAQNRLGQMLEAGLGVPRDREAALRWLALAAEGGDPAHLFDHASVLEATDPAGAAALYRRASEAGHVAAATSLGVLLQEGTGVDRDPEAARALYEAAAESGDARAMNNLGLLHARGDGAPQDHARAARLFAAAAEAGLRPAMTNLAVMYENGFGVPVDEARAAELYRLGGAGADAADPGWTADPRIAPVAAAPEARAALVRAAGAGDPVAQFQLALALAGEGGFAATRRAAALFEAAAAKGHGPSMANLGRMHFLGLAVPQDYVLGQMWLLLAQRAGTDTAPLALAFGGRATPAQTARAQEMAQARVAAGTGARPQQSESLP